MLKIAIIPLLYITRRLPVYTRVNTCAPGIRVNNWYMHKRLNVIINELI